MKRQQKEGIPEAFTERLQELFPQEIITSIEHAFASKRPTTLRVNTTKTTIDILKEKFTQYGIQLTPVLWWSAAFMVTGTPLRTLTELPEYLTGQFYVQSLSSMIPPLVLAPQPNETILDLTAAPGSKTTQMAALMQNTGRIVANDNSHIRIFRLKANLEVQGATNTVVTNQQGQIFWQEYPEYFDRTLVDVPCSMEGRFQTDDPKSYLHWAPKKVKELAERQRFLLRSALSATKVGGTIVYSTCTLAPEENEGVIDWLLRKEGAAVTVEPIEIPHITGYPPILSWHTKTYHPDVSKTLRILPSETMEGFFVAKLKKTTHTVPGNVLPQA